MKKQITLATPKQKPKKLPSKAAHLLALKLMAEMDTSESF